MLCYVLKGGYAKTPSEDNTKHGFENLNELWMQREGGVCKKQCFWQWLEAFCDSRGAFCINALMDVPGCGQSSFWRVALYCT